MSDDVTRADDGDAVPPIDPAQEAAVAALLGALPDPQLPSDVERRIVAAVAAGSGAADRPTPPGLHPDDAAPPRLPNDGRSREVLAPRPPSGRWRSPRLLQAASIVVIIALVGAAAIGVVSSRGGDQVAPDQLVLSQQELGPITVSGYQYNGANLGSTVSAIVAGDGPEAPKSAALSFSGGGEAAADTESSADPTSAASLVALVKDPDKRQACVDQLASVPGAQPVAIDVGSYDGKLAAVIVLPDEDDPTKVAAWVVGPTCSTADNPFPYRYERITRP